MRIKIETKDFSVRYGEKTALSNLNLQIFENEIFGIIGPAGSGKTTFLRSLDRINDLNPKCSVQGKLLYDGIDIYGPSVDVSRLRRLLGMVFAVPTPLPGSIYQNLALGPVLKGKHSRRELDGLVEKSLKQAFLWDEVKDRLDSSVFELSGGQQQRLCLARTLALEPDVLLLDEPCSGLDPISTAKIEEALVGLKKSYTVVLVTNNVMQASRISDRTAFFLQGELVEIDETARLFTMPANQKTQDYITGRFG